MNEEEIKIHLTFSKENYLRESEIESEMSIAQNQMTTAKKKSM